MRDLPEELSGNGGRIYNRLGASPEAKTVFDELYVKAKTQKAYAAERGVTEKYIQILNKRLLLYLQANVADG